MVNNQKNNAVKMFVFGTLRKGGRLDYYMDGSEYAGVYYTEGQLMMSEIGSAYIDFKETGVATIGELHYIDYPGLLRINHLESTSGEFPKGYDLDLLPVWKLREDGIYTFSEEDKSFALFYRRRNDPIKVKCGDWINRRIAVDEIGRLLKEETEKILTPQEVIDHMKEYLGY